MRAKLLASGIIAGVLVTGIGFGGHTYAAGDAVSSQVQVTSDEELRAEQAGMSDQEIEMASEQIIKIHEGETPISISVNEKTGIVVEVYEVKESPIQTYAAGWQIIATDWLTLKNDFVYRYQPDRVIAYSGGGDFGVRVAGHTQTSIQGSKPLISYRLYEYDPQNADDFVDEASFLGTSVSSYDVIWRGIGKFVDGTNKKAEFYVAHAENYRTDNGLLKIQYID